MPGITLAGMTFDAHTLLFASLATLCGYQSILFAILTKTFAISEGLLPEDPRMNRFFGIVNLERGLIISSIALLVGVGLLAMAINHWRLTGFGHLDYAQTMRLVVPGATLTALGFQTILSSFFCKHFGNAPAMTEGGHKTFDAYADDYDVALAHGISVSGENKDYFAQRRIEWLRDCLNRIPAPITALMDFGCGTGSSSRLFFDILGVENFVGMDQSPKIFRGREEGIRFERAQFLLFDEYQPCGQFDLVFCNGVFHHIPPLERAAAIDYVLRSLRPGGYCSRSGRTILGIQALAM